MLSCVFLPVFLFGTLFVAAVTAASSLLAVDTSTTVNKKANHREGEVLHPGLYDKHDIQEERYLFAGDKHYHNKWYDYHEFITVSPNKNDDSTVNYIVGYALIKSFTVYSSFRPSETKACSAVAEFEIQPVDASSVRYQLLLKSAIVDKENEELLQKMSAISRWFGNMNPYNPYAVGCATFKQKELLPRLEKMTSADYFWEPGTDNGIHGIYVRHGGKKKLAHTLSNNYKLDDIKNAIKYVGISKCIGKETISTFHSVFNLEEEVAGDDVIENNCMKKLPHVRSAMADVDIDFATEYGQEDAVHNTNNAGTNSLQGHHNNKVPAGSNFRRL